MVGISRKWLGLVVLAVPDTRRGHNAKVDDQSHMERVFAEYFGGLVSEWNPCCDDNGNVRYKWDQEVRAHDV